jgi:hypothetical protein
MNNDMLPFALFLVYSDELKRQSDRVIMEINENKGKGELVVKDQVADGFHNIIEEFRMSSAAIVRELGKKSAKEVAAEILAALKDDENDIFDRAANYVYMYYAEIMEEIKANGNQALKMKGYVAEIKDAIGHLTEMLNRFEKGTKKDDDKQ